MKSQLGIKLKIFRTEGSALSYCDNPWCSKNYEDFSSVYKQLLDEVIVISRIIKVEVSSASADNTNRDLHYSGYHKNRI